MHLSFHTPPKPQLPSVDFLKKSTPFEQAARAIFEGGMHK